MTQLTERQKVVLKFINLFIEIKGFPPCLREIAEGLNMKSRSNIHRIVHILQDKRYLRMMPLEARTIKVSNSGKSVN